MQTRADRSPAAARDPPLRPTSAGSAATASARPDGTVGPNASVLLCVAARSVPARSSGQQRTAVVVLRVADPGKREEIAPTDRTDERHQHFVLQPGLHGDVGGQLLLEAAEHVPHVWAALHVGAAVVLEAATQDRAG